MAPFVSILAETSECGRTGIVLWNLIIRRIRDIFHGSVPCISLYLLLAKYVSVSALTLFHSAHWNDRFQMNGLLIPSKTLPIGLSCSRMSVLGFSFRHTGFLHCNSFSMI
jgi:hypothetical protein